MDWITERWVIEAIIYIAVGVILVKIICIFADLMDRD
jgi:hypothetical protein